MSGQAFSSVCIRKRTNSNLLTTVPRQPLIIDSTVSHGLQLLERNEDQYLIRIDNPHSNLILCFWPPGNKYYAPPTESAQEDVAKSDKTEAVGEIGARLRKRAQHTNSSSRVWGCSDIDDSSSVIFMINQPSWSLPSKGSSYFMKK